MVETPSDQPMPSGPLPWPLSYESASEGVSPAVPGGKAIFTVSRTLPLFKFASNDSPSPSMLPGPFGTEITFGRVDDLSSAATGEVMQAATRARTTTGRYAVERFKRSRIA